MIGLTAALVFHATSCALDEIRGRAIPADAPKEEKRSAVAQKLIPSRALFKRDVAVLQISILIPHSTADQYRRLDITRVPLQIQILQILVEGI